MSLTELRFSCAGVAPVHCRNSDKPNSWKPRTRDRRCIRSYKRKLRHLRPGCCRTFHILFSFPAPSAHGSAVFLCEQPSDKMNSGELQSFPCNATTATFVRQCASGGLFRSTQPLLACQSQRSQVRPSRDEWNCRSRIRRRSWPSATRL